MDKDIYITTLCFIFLTFSLLFFREGQTGAAWACVGLGIFMSLIVVTTGSPRKLNK